MSAYRLLKETLGHEAGTVVYPLRGPDYGLASNDSRMLKTPCRSMTLDPGGDYPGFVVPVSNMEAISH
jgi:hypothetical protein